MEDATLLDEMTQMTPDGQRVSEVWEYETEVNGEQVTTHSAVARPATLKEQVEFYADDMAAQAVKAVTLANSATVETGGSDEEPTVTITLSMLTPDELEEEATPHAAAATSSRPKTAQAKEQAKDS